MTRRVHNLIESSIDIVAGDVIYFTFKKNRFQGKLNQTGLIYNIIWTRPSFVSESIFVQRFFESLTDWTETCIQEKLDEYHTRYSAWRRVRHERTGKTMEQLYKEYVCLNLQDHVSKLSTSELVQLNHLNKEKILEMSIEHDELNKKVQEWETWFRKQHPNTALPVKKPVDKNTPVAPVVSNPVAVQPLVLNSPGGTYLVIQRMAEKHPKELHMLTGLGLTGFRKLADKFTREKQEWHPPTKREEWFLKGVDEINKNPRLVASAVHNFFN